MSRMSELIYPDAPAERIVAAQAIAEKLLASTTVEWGNDFRALVGAALQREVVAL
jgi:hypothetical protein